MASLQANKFKSLDEFLHFLPESEYQITQQLRQMVLNEVPGVEEKLSYNVPYYKRNKGLFFIWPGAVLWGKKRTYDGVRFGFQRAHLLEDPFEWLNRGERKQVAWHDFQTLSNTDLELLRYFIHEAVLKDR